MTRIFIFFIAIFFVSPALADWHNDYVGKIGDNEIGLTITTNDLSWGTNKEYNASDIKSSHYFYKKWLKDIPLKVVSLNGRNVVIEEYNENGKVNGRFELSFEKQDPQHHFSTQDDLIKEVMVGSWVGADGKNKLPVYLMLHQGVSVTDDGSRCDPNYPTAEKRIQEFYFAILKNDTKTLKEKFNSPKLSKKARDLIAQSTPHDLFCNWKGIMLGNGIVWFDNGGNIIKVNQ